MPPFLGPEPSCPFISVSPRTQANAFRIEPSCSSMLLQAATRCTFSSSSRICRRGKTSMSLLGCQTRWWLFLHWSIYLLFFSRAFYCFWGLSASPSRVWWCLQKSGSLPKLIKTKCATLTDQAPSPENPLIAGEPYLASKEATLWELLSQKLSDWPRPAYIFHLPKEKSNMATQTLLNLAEVGSMVWTEWELYEDTPCLSISSWGCSSPISV